MAEILPVALVGCCHVEDIDYLPEKGVDYSDCDVPMQLSAEIAPGIKRLARHSWREMGCNMCFEKL